jgi:hypothetical protein
MPKNPTVADLEAFRQVVNVDAFWATYRQQLLDVSQKEPGDLSYI